MSSTVLISPPADMSTPGVQPDQDTHTRLKLKLDPNFPSPSNSLSHTNIINCLMHNQMTVRKPPAYHTQQHLNNVLSTTTEMHCSDILGHHGCVNAIDFSNQDEEFMASGGDDKRVMAWRMADVIRKNGRGQRPITMETEHTSNIFTLDFSCDNSFIYSGSDDAEVIKHDFNSGRYVSTYRHLDAVFCVAAHPTNPYIVFTAGGDGSVAMVDTREPSNMICDNDVLCEASMPYHSVAVNPVEPCLVAVSNGLNGTSLHDTRQRKQVMRYRATEWILGRENGISVCFNKTGRQLFALCRTFPPTLYNIWDSKPTHSFEDYTGCYRNRVTLKSGCFMGQNDEYVASGSDDFRVYIWKIPKPVDLSKKQSFVDTLLPEVEPCLVLPGHRSIVNQVRYSTVHQTMATSGVEKIIKLWSHLPLNGDDVIQTSRAPPSRERLTPSQIHTLALQDEPMEAIDSTEEDPTVLALFDTLVEQHQNELDSDIMTDSSFEGLEDFRDSFLSSDFDDSDDMFSDTEDMFGPLPSSSRSFWLDFVCLSRFSYSHDISSSSESSSESFEDDMFTDSEPELPLTLSDVEELDRRQFTSDGGFDMLPGSNPWKLMLGCGESVITNSSSDESDESDSPVSSSKCLIKTSTGSSLKSTRSTLKAQTNEGTSSTSACRSKKTAPKKKMKPAPSESSSSKELSRKRVTRSSAKTPSIDGPGTCGNTSLKSAKGSKKKAKECLPYTQSGSSSKNSAQEPSATGKSLTATGKSSTASGKSSTASGKSSTASGKSSTAKGKSSTASGKSSTASGKSSTIKGKTKLIKQPTVPKCGESSTSERSGGLHVAPVIGSTSESQGASCVSEMSAATRKRGFSHKKSAKRWKGSNPNDSYDPPSSVTDKTCPHQQKPASVSLKLKPPKTSGVTKKTDPTSLLKEPQNKESTPPNTSDSSATCSTQKPGHASGDKSVGGSSKRTKSRRKLLASRQSQSESNYEQYQREDFLKAKPVSNFYSKKPDEKK